ncbi:type II/IV secretion system protein, partial [Myxococcota bacterium]|nr:type II/IV secretion system protein [Myxococcota bacterium]
MSSSRYSLSYVLDLLLEGGLLSAAQRRDIEVRAPQQEARLRKLYSAELPKDTTDASSLRYHVSPGELVASFEIIALNDTLIDEDRVAAIVAADSGLPFHKIDPLAL